jgi:5-oxoprolinase (ATP-hydrolysing)
MLTLCRPGGGAWGSPSNAVEVVPGNTARKNVFEPRGSVHAFTAMAEAAQ